MKKMLVFAALMSVLSLNAMDSRSGVNIPVSQTIRHRNVFVRGTADIPVFAENGRINVGIPSGRGEVGYSRGHYEFSTGVGTDGYSVNLRARWRDLFAYLISQGLDPEEAYELVFLNGGDSIN